MFVNLVSSDYYGVDCNSKEICEDGFVTKIKTFLVL